MRGPGHCFMTALMNYECVNVSENTASVPQPLLFYYICCQFLLKMTITISFSEIIVLYHFPKLTHSTSNRNKTNKIWEAIKYETFEEREWMTFMERRRITVVYMICWFHSDFYWIKCFSISTVAHYSICAHYSWIFSYDSLHQKVK